VAASTAGYLSHFECFQNSRVTFQVVLGAKQGRECSVPQSRPQLVIAKTLADVNEALYGAVTNAPRPVVIFTAAMAGLFLSLLFGCIRILKAEFVPL